METRANYIAVGMLTLLAIVAAFLFVLWIGKYNTGSNMRSMDVRIQGSVSGLGVGSTVQFNGISVGRVTALALDAKDPRFVIVSTALRDDVPVRSDTRASVGVRGLSGGAFIQLEGGTPDAPRLLSPSADLSATPPVIIGDPSSINELVARVNSIAARTERVMDGLEALVQENGASVTATIRNAETFSKALAANSDGVERLLSNADSMAKSIEGLSGKLDGTLKRTEEIVAAIDPEKVRQTIGDISETMASAKSATKAFSENSESIGRIIKNADEFTASLGDLPTKLNNSVTRIETVLAAIEPNKVSKAIDDLSSSASSVRNVLSGVDPETVRKLLTDLSDASSKVSKLAGTIDADELAASFKGLPEKLNSTVTRAEAVFAAIDPDKVGKAVNDLSASATSVRNVLSGVEPETVRKLFTELSNASGKVSTLVAAIDAERVNAAVDQITGAAKGAQQIVSDVSKVTSKFGGRADDVNQMITDASELAGRLNNSSKKLDNVLNGINGFLGAGDGSGLMADARATLAEFRRTARGLNASIASAAGGINKFTGRGLQDTQGLINDARRSIQRIDRVIRNLESNPSSLITGSGGSRVRETRSNRPRR